MGRSGEGQRRSDDRSDCRGPPALRRRRPAHGRRRRADDAPARRRRVQDARPVGAGRRRGHAGPGRQLQRLPLRGGERAAAAAIRRRARSDEHRSQPAATAVQVPDGHRHARPPADQPRRPALGRLGRLAAERADFRCGADGGEGRAGQPRRHLRDRPAHDLRHRCRAAPVLRRRLLLWRRHSEGGASRREGLRVPDRLRRGVFLRQQLQELRPARHRRAAADVQAQAQPRGQLRAPVRLRQQPVRLCGRLHQRRGRAGLQGSDGDRGLRTARFG